MTNKCREHLNKWHEFTFKHYIQCGRVQFDWNQEKCDTCIRWIYNQFNYPISCDNASNPACLIIDKEVTWCSLFQFYQNAQSMFWLKIQNLCLLNYENSKTIHYSQYYCNEKHNKNAAQVSTFGVHYLNNKVIRRFSAYWVRNAFANWDHISFTYHTMSCWMHGQLM